MLLLVGSAAAPPFGKILKSITTLLAVFQIRIRQIMGLHDPDQKLFVRIQIQNKLQIRV
jgi:hypothetical protein